MLTEQIQYVFLGEKIETIYASKKMIPSISTFFTKKEKKSCHLAESVSQSNFEASVKNKEVI